MSSSSQTLWVVATPLGNLGDLSDRAREVLGQADLILAEDTRRTGMLLKQAGLPKKKFLSLFEHNESKRAAEVVGLLQAGSSVALVSDAGTPLVSDPGYRLVRSVRQAGFRVAPVPGPSAVLAALTVSGLPPTPFTFLGFLPRKPGEQRKVLEPFAALKTTLIFFERKSRLPGTLALAHTVLGEREVCIARELTKVHEQVIICHLSQAREEAEDLLGEITVVVGPPTAEHGLSTEHDIEGMLLREMDRGGPPKEVVARVAARSQGWSRKSVYAAYQALKAEGEVRESPSGARSKGAE